MTRYVITNAFDKKGMSLFKTIAVADADRKRHITWCLDHQKGREYVKNSFGITQYMWEPLDPPGLPIADHPCSGFPGGAFSKQGVDVLGERLNAHGDLHPLKMDDESEYYLFDCWSFVICKSFTSSGACNGGVIKSIVVQQGTELPDVFMIKKSPWLIVDEVFKELAESNNLTGMVFSPVEIIFSD